MIYLSSTTEIPKEYQDNFGIMFSAKYTIGGLKKLLNAGAYWMMDNNNFTGDFDIKKWLNQLLKNLPYQDSCIGIPVPDSIGDSLKTIRLFSQYYKVVSDMGYKVSFVSQDGITPEITPWDSFDVLFVGGTDRHKLSDEAVIMIAEAKLRGKWVHVGRVNSAKRIKRFWMVDSVDGTHLTKVTGDERANSFNKFNNAVEYCRNKKCGSLGNDGQYQIWAGGSK